MAGDGPQWEALERRYGRPAVLAVEQPVAPHELELVRGSLRRGRDCDLTVFAFAADGRLAVIRKPGYPPGAYRAPSGGARAGEPPEAAALREMDEELGVAVALHRYVLRVEARFSAPRGDAAWRTHVFTARAPAGPLQPRDRVEIAEARWCTPAELQGPVRRALLTSGRGLFRYRVALTDAVAALLDAHPALRP